MKKLLLFVYALVIVSLAFIPGQSDFLWLIVSVAISFFLYYHLVKEEIFSVTFLVFFGIGLRAILIFAFPNLSDDIYRFLWDGRLIHYGISPYSFLPSEVMAEDFKFATQITGDSLFISLYPKLNSPDYYSVYPTFSQFVFYLSTWKSISNVFTSVLIIKALLFLAESLTILYGIKLLRLLQMKDGAILWYVLNPLILLEIMGNMHFEGFMVSFFVLFSYALLKNRENLSSVFIALSISTKLIPLIFLPYFVFSLTIKNWVIFFLKTGIILMLIFSPILYEYQSFAKSLELYFQKFEFNASIYYLARTVGIWISGYNLIKFIGPILAGLTFIFILLLSWKVVKRDEVFFKFSLVALTIYLLLSTTVHPWYLCLGVLLSVFTNMRYMIYWSGLVMLSYAKYGGGDGLYYGCIILEYLTLTIFIVKDWKNILSLFLPAEQIVNGK